MLALQNMRSQSERDTPLGNITNHNGSARQSSPGFDALSSQLLSLTSICTNLQREMAQLSRRSKDNATDLISLKEATNSRDEDIRKSLKELSLNLNDRLLDTPTGPHSGHNLNAFLLEDKAHITPSRSKNFSLPRIPSPNSFAASIDRELAGTPSLVSSDGAASIALLEKVLREMGTKEGQEKIMGILDELSEKSPQAQQTSWDPSLSQKLEEILRYMKENMNSQALVKASNAGFSNAEFNSPRSGQITRVGREVTPQVDDKGLSGPSAQIISDEMMTLLKRIKGSVTEGGGLTNEVKALVRELRGEVLGMGRELARKLEHAESSQGSETREIQGLDREEITQIVETGLKDLRKHLDQVMREKRRESMPARSPFEAQEIYHAVRNAVTESMPQDKTQQNANPLEKEEILQAVREAWGDCKPEIELQGFGIEREEIIDCIKQGMQSYQAQSHAREAGASYDEVLEAVQRGLQDFRPPPIETESSITREEILMAVRECLETFDFPVATSAIPREIELTRDDVFEAVKDGLATQAPISKEIEFNREDLFDAVKAGLEGAPTPLGGIGEQVLEQMHEFITSMKTEFKQYSAANGRDTEQVLDAMKDGLEDLRADIESYVDRASDVTGKDEIIETVKEAFRALQDDMEKGFANAPRPAGPVDTPELLDAMEKEFNYLRETITKTMVQSASPNDKAEILDAIRDISESDRGSSLTVDTSNVAAMVKEELEHLRETLASMLVRQGGTIEREEIQEAVREAMDAHHVSRKMDGSESMLSNTSELLDAFQEGVEGIRADMQKLADRPVDMSSGFDILDDIKENLQNVRSEIEKLHDNQQQLAEVSAPRDQELMSSEGNLISTEIEGLKVMITQLRIKVEALDSMPPQPAPEPSANSVTKDDLEELFGTLKDVQLGVNDLSTREPPAADVSNSATKEDIDAIETLVRNAKAHLEQLDPEQIAKFEHIEALDDMLIKVKETVDSHKETGVSKEEFGILESMLKDVAAGIEELQGKVNAEIPEEEKVTKADIQAVETLCLDTKTQIEELNLPDPESLPNKADIESLHDKLKGLQEQIEADNELTAQAFDARKTEHGGLATKIDDAQAIINDLREELMKKLDGSEEGIVELAKTLESHNETFGTFATAAGLSEVTELLKEHFEKTHANHDATKLEVEERDAALSVKHDETKAALSKEIGDKLEEKFTELMIKYDDAQQASEASRSENTEAMTNTKTVVDDLKTLLDTLGTTVTETCERMGDDAKTVFNRVDETHGKVEELREELRTNTQAEHNVTRDEIAKTISAAERLEAQLNEHHPAVLDAIKDIANIVGQHYEHSQKASEEVKSTISSIPSAIPPLLPAPQPAPQIELPPPEKYDDSAVHEKLKTLIDYAGEAKDSLSNMTKLDEIKESLSNMSKLDEIHQKVLSAAAEISTMVATQSRLMAEHHDSKAQEAAEAAIALEKRTAQKENVEADIVRLSLEREEIAASVAALRRDQADLSGQTKRLTREVGVLETALNMRQEEMKVMESRAESLEKRILEGVMDHARSLMISRNSSTIGSNISGTSKKSREERRDKAMSLKRVPSAASSVATTKASSTSQQPSGVSSAVGLALKRRAPLQEGGNSRPCSAQGRRILSTSHVTPRPSLIVPEHHRALIHAPASNKNQGVGGGVGSLMSLKRSHSVKSNPSSYYGGRKASWGGRRSSNIANKENEIFCEEDEEEGEDGTRSIHEGDEEYEGSDTGTERRTSFAGTESDLYTVTDSMADGPGSAVSGMDSYGGSTTESNVSSTKGEVGGEMGEGGRYIGADGKEIGDDGSSFSESIVTGPTNNEDAETEGEETPLPTPSPEQHEEEEEGKILALLHAPTPEESPSADNQQLGATGGDAAGNMPSHLAGLDPPPNMKDIVMYQPSDSGLGSELPTAALSARGGTGAGGEGYFE
ncbi:hypothetical protein UCRPC4_g05604 [Phaeomoniella chlamydospora]|uniref:Chromosome segregation atpase family protein n=1 Tax=Phaeomoniella chlamydospora TaxID=158046 RepID=A0A0G2E324_PHACM|nr:hypothetical protein UCRPC4_g05604 [Phaeomoniella chlamydospora]